MSTTSPRSVSRSIRVGVLLGDALVEERLFPATAPVTIGQSLKCALSLPVDGLPHEHVLFAIDQGRIIVNVPEKMQARIAQGGTIKTDLRGAVTLEQGARGRLELGGATVLFQEVATPPKTPRVALPASVRGTLADRIDRRLALIVSGSILAHCALATWAWVIDRESTMALPEPAVAYEQSIYTITAPSFDEPVLGEPGATTPVAPEIQTPTAMTTKPSRPSVGRPPGMPTANDAEYFAKILAGNGETGRAPEMQGRRPGADLGTQIDHIRDTNGKVGTDGGGFRDPGEVRPGTSDGPVIAGPGQVNEIKKDDKEKPSRIEIKIPKKSPPGSTLTADMVLAKIRNNYMPGLQRCYKTGLVGDESLGGTVDITFTVGENGAVQDPSADGLTAQVDGCIATQMATWRFPIPRDKAGAPDETSFQVALVLKAN